MSSSEAAGGARAAAPAPRTVRRPRRQPADPQRDRSDRHHGPDHRHRRRCLAAAFAAFAAAGVVALPGCGFTLRLPPRLGFRSLAMTGFEPRSSLAEDLRRQIRAQVQLLDDPAKAEVVLHALADQRVRSVVASTAAAQVRELQLRLRFEFRVTAPDGRELIPKVQLLLSRDMSYSETFALAKEQEEAELFRDMQSDVVAQVMRRLASIRV